MLRHHSALRYHKQHAEATVQFVAHGRSELKQVRDARLKTIVACCVVIELQELKRDVDTRYKYLIC